MLFIRLGCATLTCVNTWIHYDEDEKIEILYMKTKLGSAFSKNFIPITSESAGARPTSTEELEDYFATSRQFKLKGYDSWDASLKVGILAGKVVYPIIAHLPYFARYLRLLYQCLDRLTFPSDKIHARIPIQSLTTQTVWQPRCDFRISSTPEAMGASFCTLLGEIDTKPKEELDVASVSIRCPVILAIKILIVTRRKLSILSLHSLKVCMGLFPKRTTAPVIFSTYVSKKICTMYILYRLEQGKWQ